MFKTAIIIAISLVVTNGQNSAENDCDCVSPQFCKTANKEVFPIDFRIILNEDDSNSCESNLKTCCPLDEIIPREPESSEVLLPPQKKCGGRNENGIIIKFINQNLESQFGEFPWMIEISETKPLRNINGKPIYIYTAGGSLIHPSVVLTAAHKVHDKNITTLKIRAGEWNQKSKSEPLPHQDRRVERMVNHDHYNQVTGANSIALLFLVEPFKIDEHINTVCLPPPGKSFDHANCFVTGWGTDARQTGANRVNILKNIDLQVVPHNECERMLRNATSNRFYLNQNMLCAGGEEGKSTCIGDGGSPLVCPIPYIEGSYYQAGIVVGSVGGCGLAKVPVLYTKIANYIDWINGHIGEQLNFF